MSEAQGRADGAVAGAARPGAASTGRWRHPAETGFDAAILRRLTAAAPRADEAARPVMAEANRRRWAAGDHLVVEGQPSPPQFLAAGWACAYRTLGDGRRHVFGFLMPGDAIGLGLDGGALSAITALTPAETVDAAPFLAAAQADPGGRLARALEALRADAVARTMDHAVRLGQLSGRERMADLLLELAGRAAAVGLGDGRRFPLPVVQETLADALGLSVVHVNRVLRELRLDGLAQIRAGAVVLMRPQALGGIARPGSADPTFDS